MTDAITPAAPLDAVVIALRHLDAERRLRGKYGTERDREAHVDYARLVLATAKRAEDATRPTDPAPEEQP